MNTDDFLTELSNRGFSSLGNPVLVRYLNWGGRFVANRTRPYWEQFTWDITTNPGDNPIALSSMVGLKSVDRVIGTTDNYRRRLEPVSEDQFFDTWLPLDYTAPAGRNEPTGYYVWQQLLYILPPTQSARTFKVHGRRRWVNLDDAVPTGLPVTPEDFDEAIMLATLIRCHLRSNEWDIASTLRGELDDQIEIISDEDSLLMDEAHERTEPDSRWL